MIAMKNTRNNYTLPNLVNKLAIKPRIRRRPLLNCIPTRTRVINRHRIWRQKDRTMKNKRNIQAGSFTNQEANIGQLIPAPFILPFQIGMVIEEITPVAESKGFWRLGINLSMAMKTANTHKSLLLIKRC